MPRGIISIAKSPTRAAMSGVKLKLTTPRIPARLFHRPSDYVFTEKLSNIVEKLSQVRIGLEKLFLLSFQLSDLEVVDMR
ncbi:hypothetical protein [Rhizobium sp. WSM1325]|uniref:hypothetical protein n=1 Tax=Rhizobium sp. WSM1325 TaxID=3444086 RepID=UPI0013E38C95|nr:hypothetical protein [Rhizobium leguminosarum]